MEDSSEIMFTETEMKENGSQLRFWNDPIIDLRIKSPRGYLNAAELYIPGEGRKNKS
jgi:hypothetical protein